MPNFFIDSFRIPPFLLPIYQAAGIQYDVPWQVLAAINEIETDYGRNLSVSSAGAVGWMQFLPSTWKTWGMDANGDGVADPYNPVDAIFTAARYLHAAGASKNISQAIFAYNHAGWYVQSVLLRAKLIGGMPDQLIGALTGLVEGHFPVAAPAKYADDSMRRALAKKHVKGAQRGDPDRLGHAATARLDLRQAELAGDRGQRRQDRQGRPERQQLGSYIELQDATGNIYTYAQLGSIPRTYPVPKPVKIIRRAARQGALGRTGRRARRPRRRAPAPSGAGKVIAPRPSRPPAPDHDRAPRPEHDVRDVEPARRSRCRSSPPPPRTPDSRPSAAAPMVKERLFANPHRARPPTPPAATLQVKNTAQQISNFRNYFSDVLHLAKNQYTLQPLKAGAIVVAGHDPRPDRRRRRKTTPRTCTS